MNWSVETVTKLAPKTSTLARAKKLAVTSKWPSFGRNESAIWGECKGSGASLYKTIIDTNGPAYNCSCPSREFPCKHALGLFLLAIQTENDVSIGAPPPWTDKWLEGRQKKAATPAKEKTEEDRQEDQIKRAASRQKRILEMQAGLPDLEIWLADLLREGLASVEKHPPEYWDSIAARMTDAKLRGVANMLRSIPRIIQTETEWPENVCYLLGDIHLMSKGVKQIHQLPTPLQEELLARAGKDITRKDLIEEKEAIKDEWIVLAQVSGTSDTDDNIRFRRVWLYGTQTDNYALLLDFYHTFAGTGFESSYRVGTTFDGMMVYYPGSTTQRVAQKSKGPEEIGFRKINGHQSYQSFLEEYAQETAKNPWLNRYPVYFSGVIPLIHKKEFHFLDVDKKLLPSSLDIHKSWKLLAISGGEPIDVFGEWTDNIFTPMSVIHRNQIIQLSA